MIYLCEYDNLLQQETLLERAGELGISWDSGQRKGRKWPHLRERLIARLLLEQAVRREYGIGNLAELEITLTEEGKPYSKAFPALFFNLSHCDTACACVVSRKNAGIDVERKFPFRPALARKISTREEKELLESLNPAKRERALRQLWSMKESFVKWNGRGLGYGMERINLEPCLREFTGGSQVSFLPEQGLWFGVRELAACTAAVCCEEKPGEICSVQEAELC